VRPALSESARRPACRSPLGGRMLRECPWLPRTCSPNISIYLLKRDAVRDSMRSLIMVVIILLYPTLSHASRCGTQIARAEAGLPESTAAKLHHQPTRGSVARAEHRLNADLARAEQCVPRRRDQLQGRHSRRRRPAVSYHNNLARISSITSLAHFI
jgi:hypothetical protein